MFRKLYIKLFKPTRVIGLHLTTYENADDIIKNNPQWELAKTEDENMEIGLVWIQKRIPVTE